MNHPCLLFAPNSGNTFYFRSKIPKDLVEHFGGMREFRISLKCAIKSRSLRTVKVLSKKVSLIYEDIRSGMKNLGIEEIKEILRTEIRKQILEYDDVSNDQRLTVYKLRDYLIEENDSVKLIFEYLYNLLENTADRSLPEGQNVNWKFDNLDKALTQSLGISADFNFLNKHFRSIKKF